MRRALAILVTAAVASLLTTEKTTAGPRQGRAGSVQRAANSGPRSLPDPPEADVFFLYAELPGGKGLVPLSAFRVAGQRGMLTALHGVIRAGKGGTLHLLRKVGKEYGGAAWTEQREIPPSNVRVTKVSVKYDLALIEGPQLGEGRLSVAGPESLTPGETLQIWGHPEGLRLHKRRVLAGDPPISILESVLLPQAFGDFKYRASPDHEAQVISIDGVLIVGHSGSPVLDARRRVVGVASGGNIDAAGNIGISWAVPLKNALADLRPVSTQQKAIDDIITKEARIALRNKKNPNRLRSPLFADEYIPVTAHEDGTLLTARELAQSLELRPQFPVTRYEVAAALVNSLAFQTLNGDASDILDQKEGSAPGHKLQARGGPFADIPSTYPVYSASQVMAQRGVFTGYPDGTFSGRRLITRYELATTVQRFLQEVDRAIATRPMAGTGARAIGRAPVRNKPFVDVPQAHWAYDAVQGLARRGVVTGYAGLAYAGLAPARATDLTQALRVIDDYVLDAVGENPSPEPAR